MEVRRLNLGLDYTITSGLAVLHAGKSGLRGCNISESL
jgi:hypothetical protein